jgi:outer membrane autotransporter protein
MNFRSFEPRGARRAVSLCTSALACALVFGAFVTRPASADGGAGTNTNTSRGGAGGTGFNGAAGGAGGPSAGGGGGGAGGGAGGNGGEVSSTNVGLGGAGGTAASPSGEDGGNAALGNGGGGGGGGFNGTSMTSPASNSITLNGGKGGTGGSSSGGGAPGGGGAGGYGSVVGGTFINSGTITGGTCETGGASGDAAAGTAGNGGDGGVGVQFTASGVTLTNSANGTITGGKGGAAGSVTGGQAGIAGAGGSGVVGAMGGGLTVINSGTITAGMSGDGMTRANAITFTSGAQNTLQLQSGSTISGNVVGTGNDMLQLGGASNASMDVSKIGATAQYQGFGNFQKVGTSTWTLTGTNAGAMNWSVNAGTLVANGSIANSAMTVNNGGTLSGTGTVGATTVMSGGVFAPGSGTAGSSMSVNGSLTFATGATYMVQISTTASSMANVTGTATLTGGTVQAVFATGSYMTNSYTILHTTGGLTGTFAGVNSSTLPMGFTETVTNVGNDVKLNLTANLGGGGGGGGPSSIPGGGLNANQQNVANGLNNFFNNGSALPPAFLPVFNQTGNTLGNSLAQLSGEGATGAQQSANTVMTEFMNSMFDHALLPVFSLPTNPGTAFTPPPGFAPERAALPDDLALAYAKALGPAAIKAPPFEQRWNVWASGFGGQNTTRGDATIGSHDLTASAGGAAEGADYHLTRDSVIGFALAGAGTNWSLAQGLGGGRSDAFQAGIYGATRSGPAYLAGTLAFANSWVSTSRTALGDQLTASFNAQSFGGRVEAGYRFAMPFGGIAPYAALQATSFRTPSFTETDVTGGGFGLSFQGRTATDTRGELGARFDHAEIVSPDSVLTVRGRLAWAHDWDSDPALTAAFQALPGASFIVNGATPASDLALVTAGAELAFRNGLALSGKFDGEFASRAQTYAGTATLRYRW